MKTQDDCKKEFLDLCSEFLTKIDKIDKNTPWTEFEPAWWLEMSETRKQLQEIVIRNHIERH